MNKRERLIAETFGNNDGASFARRAAAHARRRRTAKRMGFAAGLALVLAAGLHLTMSPATRPHHAPIAIAPIPTVEIISDQELLAQLQGQPVLILKDRTGITDVVFLPATSERRL